MEVLKVVAGSKRGGATTKELAAHVEVVMKLTRGCSGSSGWNVFGVYIGYMYISSGLLLCK